VNVFERRIETLRGAMGEASVDAVLLTPSGDMTFITGLPRPGREPTESHKYGDYLQGVLITADRVVTIVPYLAHLGVDVQLETRPWLAAEVIHLPDGVDEPDEGYRPFAAYLPANAVVGLPKHALAMTALRIGRRFPGFRFVCTEDLVSPMRMVKDPEDLEAMRRSCLAADLAFTEVVKHLHPGVWEAEVYRELDWQMRLIGADGTSFGTALMSGSADEPFRFGRGGGGPMGRQLSEGCVLAFDYGFLMDGWCSDFGRTVYFGEPTAEMREAHFLVAEAQRRAMEVMVGGAVTCAEVDAAARDFLTEAGRGHEFIHRLGHSIGMDVHEHPFLCYSDQTLLRNGMTFTVEPSLYAGGDYIVRVEDVVVVAADGGRSLNVTPTFEMTVVA
jgi:Xaa-Pro aminopeptidase